MSIQKRQSVDLRRVGSIKEEDIVDVVNGYLRKKCAAVVPEWSPKPGFVYNQVRAISARVNQNYDAWPSDELKLSYKTFLGKPCFVNHRNEDWTKARGRVVAARYVEKGDDKYIDVIQEVDGKRFPKLAKEIVTGGMDSVSMGVEAGFTICSVCENKATDVFDMCKHIKFHKGEHMANHKTGERTLVYEKCHKLGFFELSYVFDPADETAVVSRVIAAARQQPPPPSGWYRTAFGEVEVPEDVDTLRDDSEDEDDADGTFHNWITSPAELRDPDTEKAKRFDRHQEDQGLDDSRRVEDMEDFGASSARGSDRHDEDEHETAMPINAPATKRSRRTTYRGASMSRRRYYAAEDEDQYPPSDDGSGYPDDGGQDDGSYDDDQGGHPDDGGGDPSMGGGQEDPDALVSQAEEDLAQYDQMNGGGDSGDDYGDDGSQDFGPEDDGSDPYGDGSDESGGDDEDGGPSDYGDPDAGGDPHGGDLPPWLQDGGGNRESRRRANRPVKKRSGRGNRRAVAAQGRANMGQGLAQRGRVASTRRHFTADDNGYTDGGPYGNDMSQGAQEDIFLSQVPGAEAVALPDDGDTISNNENNLVASRQANQGQFDPGHYQRLADVISAMAPEERHAVAHRMARQLLADNGRFNWRTFYTAARVPITQRIASRRYAEELEHPDKVDPMLPDTGADDIKGSEFESLALDNVETQPKDASIHAFKAFDRWLASATGRTARQHGNGNFIRNAAVSYAKQHRNPQAALQGLFPTLEYVLVQARKNEGRTAAMNRYAEDESLDVAAPGARIDVEAPVRNVTDEEAQSSQFDLGDFANNASDGMADPVLDPVDGNAGTWAPDKGKESSLRLASGVEAMRCAEAHIAAMPNTYKKDDRWKLTARFETMRQSVVRDRTRLCEQMIQDQRVARRSARKVTAGTSRGTNGLPRGIGRRSASVNRQASGSDPSNPNMDSSIFF